jgi:hypothetical protein
VAIGTSRADVKVAVLAIGNNEPPAARPSLPRLEFADDDAAAFLELLGPITNARRLLAVMDPATRGLYPGLTAAARDPTMAELRAAVTALATALAGFRAAGHQTALFVFFSGHGWDGGADRAGGTGVGGGAGAPALALADGAITRALLYDEILGALQADQVHLIVDACHAESVVRPRDADARDVEVSPALAASLLARTTLARFPRVGAILAAARDGQAHEWDALGQGVLTHELLSALRGGADVNRDRRIEYSELAAFLSAANLSVDNPRARLAVVVHPPPADGRTPLLDLGRLPPAGVIRLNGIPARAGRVEVQDGAGRSLAIVRSELGFASDLVLPAGRTLYVRAGDGEARIEPASAGLSVGYGQLSFARPSARRRGAIEDSVRRGLYATPYGPSYYRGFMGSSLAFVPVALSDLAVAAPVGPASAAGGADAPLGARADGVVVRTAAPEPPGAGRAASVAAGPSIPMVTVGLGLSTAVARTVGVGQALRLGWRPGGARRGLLLVDLSRAGGPGSAEWRSLASAGWTWRAWRGPAAFWIGGAGGGGAIVQQARAKDTLVSGVLAAGPLLGMAISLTDRLGLWAEAQGMGMAYRLDGQNATSLEAAAWVGLSLGP